MKSQSYKSVLLIVFAMCLPSLARAVHPMTALVLKLQSSPVTCTENPLLRGALHTGGVGNAADLIMSFGDKSKITAFTTQTNGDVRYDYKGDYLEGYAVLTPNQEVVLDLKAKLFTVQTRLRATGDVRNATIVEYTQQIQINEVICK